MTSPISICSQQLVQLRRQAHQLALQHTKIRTRQSGGYLSKLRGRGVEFDEVRIYQPGDEVKNIDWRVTARTGTAHTKLYREERERPVMICLDYQRSMHFATRKMFKSVFASQIAAILAWAANHNGDRVGGILFSEQESTSLKARRGKHAILSLFQAMAATHNAVPHGSITSPRNRETMDNTLLRLRRLTKPGSLVFILSDFQGLDENNRRHLSELARHSEVILIFVYDPIEAQLPQTGQYRFKDETRSIQIDINPQQQARHTEQFQSRQRTLQQLAQRYRMHLLSCSTALDPIEQLRQQMEVLAV